MPHKGLKRFKMNSFILNHLEPYLEPIFCEERVDCMKAKYYLRQVRRLDNIVNAKLEQIEMLKSIATKITSDMSNERVSSSTVSDKVGSTVAKIIDLETEINESIDRLIELKAEVMRIIDNVEEDDYKLLLTLRYLNFKTWEQIAVEMEFTFQWVHELHKRALIEIEKVQVSTLDCN